MRIRIDLFIYIYIYISTCLHVTCMLSMMAYLFRDPTSQCTRRVYVEVGAIYYDPVAIGGGAVARDSTATGGEGAMNDKCRQVCIEIGRQPLRLRPSRQPEELWRI